MQFRSFRTRLLASILGLTATAQFVAFAVVRHLHRTNAEQEVRKQLSEAADQFNRAVEQRTTALAKSAAALSWYAGLSRTLTTTRDPATLQSALESSKARVGAGVVALLSLDGQLLATTSSDPDAVPMYRALQAAADQAESASATGYGSIGGGFYSVAVVPLRSPDIVAWIAVGFPLDRAFVTELKASTGVEITLRRAGVTLATTVAAPAWFATEVRELKAVVGPPADISLQYSFDEKLAPARRLERILALVFAGSLLLASGLAVGIARGVSEPVRQLAAHTRHIARGDYGARVDLNRADELGQLATAFNEMGAGLAERDRIRDLLDKNVSPEVAAQLLRDGAALGGEEREVTVLFADLRGFTTLSERLSPPELLTLLNRYLDRMSTEIEREGGVIDKFIGDAIMALFGAPVAQADSAARALRAAGAMEAALVQLNQELAAEGRPPLAIGIGINTARVVAGNIGSHRRLNYSVIGDGVNIAARLQSLTRTAEYRTNIITSAATRAGVTDAGELTFRPLGTVAVKGRAQPVEVFAVDRSA